MSWLLRLVLLLIIVLMIRSLLNRLFSSRTRSPRPTRRSAPPESKGKMVRDPQCGMYVALDLAIPSGKNRETAYFCSEECRQTYFQRAKAG